MRTRGELVEYFAGQARQAFSLQYVLEVMVLVLVLVGIGDTLASGVVERTRELGMLRAVGMSRRQLFGMVTLEGLAIGSLGVVLAVVAGVGLGVFWVEEQFPRVMGWKLDLHVPWRVVGGIAVVTMALCLLGSLLPALRAARLSVPEALRNE
ncbi:MAG: hypothetical protein KatS3mg076_2948 [Candidatus Binatia bacterium]|nr:MAG: hypothetical protein KatS3mg076_2948 [Candidatus Binatia bacterium]